MAVVLREELLRRPEVTVLSALCSGRGPEEPAVVPGGHDYELCLVRAGCFHVRGSRQDTFVDPTRCILGEPGHAVEVSHPGPGRDVDTFVLLSEDVLAALGGGDLGVPAEAAVTTQASWFHQRLLATARRSGEAMALEELALLLFATILGGVEPARVAAGDPTERRHRVIVDDARAALVADPTIASVVELGRAVGCSPHHLSRLFSRHTGMGVARYRLVLRTRQALDVVAQGEGDLSRVAHEFGFSDLAHLSRSVKREHGSAPSHLLARLAASG